MSDNTIDLFIQDFVTTNKVLGAHYEWISLVNRRFVEDGLRKIFTFQSGDKTHIAVGTHMALPDGDWFRIELTHAIPPVEIDHTRFDCLRMMQSSTHTGLAAELLGTNTMIVKLTTRHRGLVNIVFVVRDGLGHENVFVA